MSASWAFRHQCITPFSCSSGGGVVVNDWTKVGSIDGHGDGAFLECRQDLQPVPAGYTSRPELLQYTGIIVGRGDVFRAVNNRSHIPWEVGNKLTAKSPHEPSKYVDVHALTTHAPQPNGVHGFIGTDSFGSFPEFIVVVGHCQS